MIKNKRENYFLHTEIIQQLGELPVMDENRESVILSSLWKEKKSVLVFVRHFG